jgi:hypothetical protein
VWFINQRSQVEPSVAFFASLKLTVTTARIGSKANCRRSVAAARAATGQKRAMDLPKSSS